MIVQEREMLIATAYAWWWECRYRTEPKPDTQYWNEFIESDVYKAIDKDYSKGYDKINQEWQEKIQARLKELSYSSKKGFNPVRIQELSKLIENIEGEVPTLRMILNKGLSLTVIGTPEQKYGTAVLMVNDKQTDWEGEPIEGRTKENLLYERNEVIMVLRGLCERYGDNDWSDDLHIADILTHHLEDYLDEKVKGDIQEN